RESGHLGKGRAQAQARDRQAHRAPQVRGAAPSLGCGADLRVDHQITPHSPGPRATPPAPRDDGLLVDDHHHEPPPRKTQPVTPATPNLSFRTGSNSLRATTAWTGMA